MDWEAQRRFNAKVAVEVLGQEVAWTPVKRRGDYLGWDQPWTVHRNPGRRPYRTKLMDFCGNSGDAMWLVEQLRKRRVYLDILPLGGFVTSAYRVVRHGTELAEHDSLPMAICLAALKAVVAV